MITYKVTIEKFQEYFLDYNRDKRAVKIILWVDKVLNYIFRKGFVSFLLFSFGIFVSLFLIRFVVAGIVFLILNLFGINVVGMFRITINDIAINVASTSFLLIMLYFIQNSLKAEMPFYLKDMITDRNLLRVNGRNELENNYLKILAFLKYEGPTGPGFHKIMGYSSATALADAEKKMRDEVKINGVNLLTTDKKYIDWKFEIIDPNNVFANKEDVENTLKLVWDYYLRIEYVRLKNRRSILRRISSTGHFLQ